MPFLPGFQLQFSSPVWNGLYSKLVSKKIKFSAEAKPLIVPCHFSPRVAALYIATTNEDASSRSPTKLCFVVVIVPCIPYLGLSLFWFPGFPPQPI